MRAEHRVQRTVIDEQIEAAKRSGAAKVGAALAGAEQEIRIVTIDAHFCLSSFLVFWQLAWPAGLKARRRSHPWWRPTRRRRRWRRNPPPAAGPLPPTGRQSRPPRPRGART